MPLSTTLESAEREFDEDDWDGQEPDPEGDELQLDEFDDIDEGDEEEEGV